MLEEQGEEVFLVLLVGMAKYQHHPSTTFTTLLEGEWKTCFVAGTQGGAPKEWRGTLGTKNGHTVEVGLAYYNEGNGSNREEGGTLAGPRRAHGIILAFSLRARRGYHAGNKLL